LAYSLPSCMERMYLAILYIWPNTGVGPDFAHLAHYIFLCENTPNVDMHLLLQSRILFFLQRWKGNINITYNHIQAMTISAVGECAE
jgi:hypothetical protein